MKKFIEEFVIWTLWGLIYVILMLFGILLAVATFQVLLGLLQ